MFPCEERSEENTIRNTKEKRQENAEFSQNKENKIDFDLVTLKSGSELIQSNRTANLSVLNDNLENPLSSTSVDSQMKSLVKTSLELLPRVLETSNLVTAINDSGIILEKKSQCY